MATPVAFIPPAGPSPTPRRQILEEPEEVYAPQQGEYVAQQQQEYDQFGQPLVGGQPYVPDQPYYNYGGPQQYVEEEVQPMGLMDAIFWFFERRPDPTRTVNDPSLTVRRGRTRSWSRERIRAYRHASAERIKAERAAEKAGLGPPAAYAVAGDGYSSTTPMATYGEVGAQGDYSGRPSVERFRPSTDTAGSPPYDVVAGPERKYFYSEVVYNRLPWWEDVPVIGAIIGLFAKHVDPHRHLRDPSTVVWPLEPEPQERSWPVPPSEQALYALRPLLREFERRPDPARTFRKDLPSPPAYTGAEFGWGVGDVSGSEASQSWPGMKVEIARSKVAKLGWRAWLAWMNPLTWGYSAPGVDSGIPMESRTPPMGGFFFGRRLDPYRIVKREVVDNWETYPLGPTWWPEREYYQETAEEHWPVLHLHNPVTLRQKRDQFLRRFLAKRPDPSRIMRYDYDGEWRPQSAEWVVDESKFASDYNNATASTTATTTLVRQENNIAAPNSLPAAQLRNVAPTPELQPTSQFTIPQEVVVPEQPVVAAAVTTTAYNNITKSEREGSIKSSKSGKSVTSGQRKIEKQYEKRCAHSDCGL